MSENPRINSLLQAFEHNKEDPFIPYAIAIEYKNEEAFDQALHFFELVFENFPNYVATYFHYAGTLEALDRNEEALDMYERGLVVAREAGDDHAYAELSQAKSALENL